MGGKSDSDFEDDLDFNDEGVETSNASDDEGVSGVSFSPRSRRNWRDVERAREEREMRRLLNPVDDWMADLDEAPRRHRRG